MKKIFIILSVFTVLLTGCTGEYNKVFKTSDFEYRYEYAKQMFAEGKYTRAAALLQDMIAMKKGTSEAQEALYMLAMSEYMSRDYESAAMTFKKYGTSYPKGVYAEQASFYVGQALFESAPEPRLDQTPTLGAINAYQQFLDFFPESPLRSEAQRKLYILQDKLVQKAVVL